MNKLQCEICGGNLVMDGSGDFAVCESCGMQFKKETIKKMLVELSGPVKIDGTIQVDGLASLEKLIQNGEKFSELGEFEKARQVFTKISNEYPEDYRGWWGILCALTHNFTYYADAPKGAANAIKLAPEGEKSKLKQKYDEWVEKLNAEARRLEMLKDAEARRNGLNEKIAILKRSLAEANEDLSKYPNLLAKSRAMFYIWLVIGILDIIWFFYSVANPSGWLILTIPVMLGIISIAFACTFMKKKYSGCNQFDDMQQYARHIEGVMKRELDCKNELQQATNELNNINKSIAQYP